MFRNNSGGFTCPHTGRLVLFGLGNISKKYNAKVKSSDNIGFTPVVITQEMVGKKIPVFTAFEDKTPQFVIRDVYPEGSREAAQAQFGKIITNAGGIFGFTRSAADVDKILEEYVTWLTSPS